MASTIQEILANINIPPPRECGQELDKYSRLKTYYYFLEISERTTSAQETLDLINNIIVKVEDCHSGRKAEENPGFKYVGRMYPIKEDMVERKNDGRIVALTKGNKIIIEPNGGFAILSRSDDTPILIKSV